MIGGLPDVVTIMEKKVDVQALGETIPACLGLFNASAFALCRPSA